MKKNLFISIILLFLVFTISESQAIGLTFYNSEKTKKTSTVISYGSSLGSSGYNLPFNLSISPKFSYFLTSYSDFVGQTANQEIGNSLFSFGADVSYNLNIAHINTKFASFTPVVSPYIGYEHYWNEVKTNGFTSWANSGGISYGIRLYSALPLGFDVQIGGGATSLFNSITMPIVEGRIGWYPVTFLNISFHTGLRGFPDFHQNKGTAMNSYLGFNVGFGIL